MDRVSAFLDEVNRALAPWAQRIGDIQNAPVWVIGALILGIIGSVIGFFKSRADKKKQAERDADLKSLKQGQVEQTALIEKVLSLYGAQLETEAAGGNDPRRALRETLNNLLTSSDPRGAEVAQLLIQKKSDDAQALSAAIAADAEQEAAALGAAAKQANQRAARKWWDASVIAMLTDRNAALDAIGKAVALDPDNPTYYNTQGVILQGVGRYADADKSFLECQKRLAPNNEAGLAILLGNRGGLAREQVDLDGAEALFTRALEIHRALGDKLGIAKETGNLGIIAFNRHKFDEAEAMFKQAYDGLMMLNDKANAAKMLDSLSAVQTMRGDHQAAGASLEAVGALIAETGDKNMLARHHRRLGDIEREQGHLEAAGAYYDQSLKALREMGDPVQAGVTEAAQAMLAVYSRDPDRAEALVQKVLATADTYKNTELKALATMVLGVGEIVKKNKPEARRYLAEARDLYRAANHPHAQLVETTLNSDALQGD